MTAQMEFALVFTGKAGGAKAAANEVKQAMADVAAETEKSARQSGQRTAALDKEAAAARKAAEASRVLAAEEKRAAIELDRQRAQLEPLYAAQQRYQRKLEDIAQAQRTGAVSASSAIDLRIREKSAYDALVSSMARVPAARKAAAEAAVARQTIAPDRGADIVSFFDQRDAIRARHDPRFAVLTAYREKLAEIRTDLRAGAIDQDVATAAIQRHRQAALATVNALKGRDMTGGNGRDAQFRRQNLGYQVFDIGQSAALGMPLPMVAMQQLPQIIQLYAGQGGVNAAMKDFSVLASGAAKAITPLTVGIGALTAVVATGAIAYNGYLRSTKEVETAATGLGRAVAGSKAEMEASARAGADAAGISVSSARAMEAQFLRTGRIGAEHYERLIGISKDFAVTIGVDADAAGAALAEMFATPAEAADKLYRQYGLIDAATARNVANLAAQNRQAEAQAVLLDALPGKLASAEQATTALGRAWAWVGRQASNGLDAIGRGVDRVVSGPSVEEQIRDAQREVERFSNLSWVSGVLNGGNDRRDRAQARLDELLADKQSQEKRASFLRRDAEEIARSRAAIDAANGSGVTANQRRRQELENSIAALRSGVGNSKIGPQDQANIAATLEARSRMLDALVNKQARAQELDRLDIQISNERNPLLRAELEARRTRLSMADQEVSADTIAAEAARTRNRVIEETIAAASSQAGEMRDEITVRADLMAQVAAGTLTASDANRLLQEELMLRPLVAAATSAEGAEKERLTAAVAGLRDGYAMLADQEKRMSALAYLQTQSDRLEQLRLETSLVGQSEAARRQAIAALEAEQKIRQLGIEKNGELAAQIREVAAAEAELTRNLERQRDAWDAVRSTGEDAIDTIFDGLSSGKFDFKEIGRELGSDLLKSFVELDIKNPLKNALLGTNYGTLSDVLGGKKEGPLSSIFGSGVSSMSVNAATVVINGGVLGGGGQGPLDGILGKLTGTNDNATSAAGSALSFTGNYKSGVDARLTDILDTAARRMAGFKVEAISGVRAGDPRFHGQKLATDVQLTDLLTGKKLGNYQDASSFAAYEKFAQEARAVQMAKYPELADDFRWGGYFSGGKGKYGALDTMHFDLAGKRTGMGGGSWEGGLTSAQRSLWPGIESKGNTAAAALDKLAGGAGNATGALANVGSGLDAAGNGLGELGTGFGQFGKNLSNYFPPAPSGGGGGIGGWLSSLFGGGNGLSSFGNSLLSSSGQFANAWALGGLGLYSSGGYTGPGGKFEPRGVVHAGEVVWSQRDIARAGGVQVVEAMRLGRRGYADGGPVDVMPLPAPVLAAANSNNPGNASSASRPPMNVRMVVEGAQTPEEMKRAAYQGMQQALREYDAGMPDRVQEIQNNPNWR